MKFKKLNFLTEILIVLKFMIVWKPFKRRGVWNYIFYQL